MKERGFLLCSAALSPAVMWKVEHVTNEMGDLAKEIFSQNVEGATCFLFAALQYSAREKREAKRRTVQTKSTKTC